ncbi:MAG: HPr family phosphocarrier protein [bacterium]
MIDGTVTVKNASGLHARLARVLVDELSEYEAEVTFQNGDIQAGCDSIMELMMLSAPSGTRLQYSIKGDDEQQVRERIHSLFESGFQTDG